MKGLKLIFAAYLVISSYVVIAAEIEITPSTDVRVLIDVSGSMKQNDPNNLRQSALQLIVNLLPSDSRAGIWTFGQWVNMAVKPQPINDKWREQAIAASKNISSHGLYTNIGAALDNAAYDFNYSFFDTKKTPTSIILLTDGMVDISDDPSTDATERSRILGEILDRYKAAGVVIHTIALSKDTDEELLQRLSSQSGGQFAIAESADELSKIFLQTLTNIVPATEVAIENNQFNIDASIDEFTALVFHSQSAPATQLILPDSSLIDANSSASNVRWYSGSDYDLVTINNPMQGTWQIKADEDEANRVSIVSNLSIALSQLPGSIDQGRSTDITLDVLQQGNIVSDKAFLNLLDVGITLTDVATTETTSPDLIANQDGSYQYRVPTDRTGSFALQADVKSPTFDRRVKTQFTINSLFSSDINFDPESTQLTVLITPNSPNLQIDSLNYELTLSPAINGESKTLDAADGWLWQGELRDLGDYTLNVSAYGRFTDGESFNRTLIETVISSPGVVPEPVVKVAPVPIPPQNVKPVEEKGMFGLSRKQLIIAAVGAANLLIILIAVWIYRRIKSNKHNPEESTPMAESLADPEIESQEDAPMGDLSSLQAVDIEEENNSEPVDVPSFDELMADDELYAERDDGDDNIDDIVEQAAAELAAEDEAVSEDENLDSVENDEPEVPEYFDDAIEEDVVEAMHHEEQDDEDTEDDDLDFDSMLDDAELADLELEGAALAKSDVNEPADLADPLSNEDLDTTESLEEVFEDNEDSPVQSELTQDDEITITDTQELDVDDSPQFIAEDDLETFEDIDLSPDEHIAEEISEDDVSLDDHCVEVTIENDLSVAEDDVEPLDDIDLSPDEFAAEELSEDEDDEEIVDDIADDNIEDELIEDIEHDALLDSEFAIDDETDTDLASLDNQLSELELNEEDALAFDAENEIELDEFDSIETPVEQEPIESEIDADQDLPLLNDEVTDEELSDFLEDNDVFTSLGDDLEDLSFGADSFKPAETKQKTTNFSALDNVDFDSVLDEMLNEENKQSITDDNMDDLDALLDDVSLDVDEPQDDLMVDLTEDEAVSLVEADDALQDLVANDLSADDLPDLDEEFDGLDDLDDLDSLLDDLENQDDKKS